jgi:hypothetical protein
MNLHQLRKKKAKAAAATAKVVEPTVVIKTEPATTNPIKDFIKSITPEEKPNAIKPTDFIPGRKKVEKK